MNFCARDNRNKKLNQVETYRTDSIRRYITKYITKHSVGPSLGWRIRTSGFAATTDLSML
jgi:hypothetical protein